MYKIYTDAAFNAQTKEAGIAFNAIRNGQQIKQGKYREYVLDNHEAEFQAMLMALEFLQREASTNETIMLHSDSKIVIESLDKRYVKEAQYAIWLDKILVIIDTFNLLFWKWIPDKENKGADQIAREALRKKG
ncbi:ribonuclease HI family protein [Aerococcaceae bacterium NML180378]|nr:ribonuclease HI family protein [Aerococcaceae bacterium NML180378]